MRLSTIQYWAQWIIIGEFMLVAIEFIRLIRRIFCCLVWMVLIAICILGLLSYLSNTYVSDEIWNLSLGNGIIWQLPMNTSLKVVWNYFSLDQ